MLVRLDQFLDAFSDLPQLRRILLAFGFVQVFCDLSIQLIFIDGIHTFEQAFFLSLKSRNLLRTNIHLELMILLQGFANPLKHPLVFALQAFQDFDDLYFQHFLAHVFALRAVRIESRAGIVRMTFLLLPDDRAPALTAFTHAFEQKIMLAVFPCYLSIQFLLHAIKQLLGNERFMLGIQILLALPQKFAAIETIRQDAVKSGPADPVAVAGLPAFVVELLAEAQERLFAGIIELEGTTNIWGF